jgi:hypothetical protein
MSNFAEEIQRRVAAARGAADDQTDTDRRQAQARGDQMARRVSRAGELCGEIEQRFREAAEHSSGAMVFRSQKDHYDRMTAVLSWQDPGPRRDLRFYINPSEGVMDWSWMANNVVKRAQRIDPLTFESSRIDELIYLLSDQEAWKKGTPPA